MKFEANIAGVAVALDTDTLPEVSRTFLMEYGLRQYVQDGAAVSKTFLSGDRKGEAKTDVEIAQEKREGVLERVDNLQKGEFTRRGPGTPKLSPEEKHRAEIVETKLRDAAKATGKAVPAKTGPKADKAWWDTMSERVYAKYKAEVDKEVARRLREDAKPIDVSGLFDEA